MMDGLEIFEKWLSQLSEDERNAVECDGPLSKKTLQNFMNFYTALSEEEQQAIVDGVFDDAKFLEAIERTR